MTNKFNFSIKQIIKKLCANIETHYKDITSHFQKADNYRHQSAPIYTNPHKSAQSRFKALQALFLADIAHYNYKCSCGLSKGLKMLASMMHFPIAESCAGGLGNVRIRLRPFTEIV
jgi:hypothetical protein